MKLRILDNSIRFRLTRPEVERMASEGEVTGITSMPGANQFQYRLKSGSAFQIGMLDNTMEFSAPLELIQQWATNEGRVGFRHSFDLDAGEKLELLVEKDFQCLTGDSAGNEDYYANPYKGKETEEA
jgi:hypothetical protein